MARTMAFRWLVLLVIVAAGCRMCAHPYDYCGPLYSGDCGYPCAPCVRAGSILAPGACGCTTGPMPQPGAMPVGLEPVYQGEMEGNPEFVEQVEPIHTARTIERLPSQGWRPASPRR